MVMCWLLCLDILKFGTVLEKSLCINKLYIFRYSIIDSQTRPGHPLLRQFPTL